MNIPGKEKLKPVTDRITRIGYGGWVDLALQTSLTLAIVVVIGVFAGRWLDNKFGATPIFTVVLTMWGAVGGTAWIIIKIKQFGEKREAEEKMEQEKSRK